MPQPSSHSCLIRLSSSFSGALSLHTVNFPESVLKIGYKAFAYCKKLSRVNLPKNLKVIGERAFSGDSALTEIPLPDGVDWVTLSPKDAFVGPKWRPVLAEVDELKVIFDGVHHPDGYWSVAVKHRFLQPCDTGDRERNATIVAAAMDHCMRHPEWRLSLQLHKILNIR